MAFTIVGDAAMISGDVRNSRRAAVFTGGDTDDYYQINALAIAQTAANDTTGTITAWVMPGNITSTMAIVNFNDANVVEYIDFKIVAGKLTCAVNDATVAQFTVVSTDVVCPAHVWTHVAVTQDGVSAKLYVNGVLVPQSFSVSTDVTEWFNNLDGIDVGQIGLSSIGGAGAFSEEFVGGISDVKYYDVALTAAELLADFNGVNKTANQVAWFAWNDLTNGGSEGTAAVAVSDVYITPTYNEFISRVRLFGAVVADAAGFTESNGRMSVLFINSA